MFQPRSWLRVTSALLLLGCGPAPATTTESASAPSTGSETTTDPATTGSTGTTQAVTDASSSSLDPTTTTSPTDPGDTSDTSDTCGFICEDPECQKVPGLDGELRCISCDIFAQDCPKGQKCTAWADDGGSSWNANRCVEVAANPKKPGEPCKVEGSPVTGIDDCERGAMCWDVDLDTLIGTCIGFCDGSPRAPTCAEPDTFCLLSGESILPLCLPTCDPLAGDCPEDQVCVPTHFDDFTCVLGFPGAVGAVCEFVNACDPGLVCIDSQLVPDCEGVTCCAPFCKLSDPAGCAPNLVCTPWFEPGTAPEGYEDVGVCTLPP